MQDLSACSLNNFTRYYLRLPLYFLTGWGSHSINNCRVVTSVSQATAKELQLQGKINQLIAVLQQHRIPSSEYISSNLPVIYVVTPTYARPEQKAELTRLKNIFIQVPSLHWILVEDADQVSKMVSNFLMSSGMTYTHLYIPTPPDDKLPDPNWRKPRGVSQRNAGIQWLRNKLSANSTKGVVYFADDDNTYSVELFQEMRFTQTISVWPVGLVGGVMVERPLVDEHMTVTGWQVGWGPNRPFALDMAAFAVNLRLLLSRPKVKFSSMSPRGYMESDFLKSLLVNLQEFEPRADLCTKVYVWHTKTAKPNMKGELALRRMGRPTDRDIEV